MAVIWVRTLTVSDITAPLTGLTMKNLPGSDFWSADDPQTDNEYNYTHMATRDERRFRLADRNADLFADKQEFTAFLHPEDHEHMKDIVVQVRLTEVM